MRLAIITATYKRPELTKAVLDWWCGVRVEGVEMFGIATGDHQPQVGGFWDDSFFFNSPLGAKHNHALTKARPHNPDAVMVIGSDDICEPSLIAKSCEAIKAGALWTQPKDLYFWEPETGRVSTPGVPYITGAGRVYSWRLLDALDWKLWDDEATIKLDGNALDTIMNAVLDGKIKVTPTGRGMHKTCGAVEIDGAVLDIKTGVNLWSYDEASNTTNAKDVDPSILQSFEIERFTYGRKHADQVQV